MNNAAPSVSAVGLGFTLLMGLLLLIVPRRYAMVPLIILTCYMTMGQPVVIAGLNFTMIRILLIFGWIRLAIRGELKGLKWSTMDTVVVAWTLFRTLNYTLVWGTTTALVNRLGYAYNIIGFYFLFRFLIHNGKDVYRAVRWLAVFIVPLAAFVISEKLTARNAFAIFGGVPPIPEIRDGVLRCQGPFGHSILAGTFGATSLPLVASLWWSSPPKKVLAMLAAISCLVIIALGGSSGPVLACMAAFAGLMLWPLRRQMRYVLWGSVVVLLGLQVVMNSPVWFVMARLTVFSGSTGWFRGFVIDMAVKHFWDWWLIGSNAATQWHYYLRDITNQYVLEAVDGGLVTLSLFITMLVLSFRSVGRTVRSAKTPPPSKHLAWAMGSALFAHAVTFISVSYFDQNFVMFYFVLAAIPAVAVVPYSAAQQRGQTPVPRPEALPVISSPEADWKLEMIR